MNIYFDCEFTGLYKDTKLISIGLISDDGKQFYAEVDDKSLLYVDSWIEENILNNTVMYGDKLLYDIVDSEFDYHTGSESTICNELSKWFNQFDNVQLVSDVCHYDMVLLINLFGTAFDLPENVSCYCHDINQDIAINENISESEAFNLSREEILKKHNKTIDGEKHNALYDAKVIKEIFNIYKGV